MTCLVDDSIVNDILDDLVLIALARLAQAFSSWYVKNNRRTGNNMSSENSASIG